MMAVVFSLGIFAQSQEFGVVVGGMNGLSYKKIMSENFAIQTDLAVGFQRTVATEGAYYDFLSLTIDIFDFTLDNEDISEIKKLDQKISYTNWPETMLKEQDY
jgi:hypothetical protein